MLVNPAAIQTLRVRHIVERAMHDFFNAKDFIKVNTPILQSGAGGAVARPFETEATELQGETLNLRIAPELWLKRLIVGGMERVYELGPVFRNEGVDATHNPEFTICEFYAAKASLGNLMQWTEALLRHIQSEVAAAQTQLSALDLPDLALSSPSSPPCTSTRPQNPLCRASSTLSQPITSNPSARSQLSSQTTPPPSPL
jgi:lysyl-tRNA synthetase class 2